MRQKTFVVREDLLKNSSGFLKVGHKKEAFMKLNEKIWKWKILLETDKKLMMTKTNLFFRKKSGFSKHKKVWMSWIRTLKN